MRAVWLFALLTACVHSQSVQCDDGRLCPAESTCIPGGCATLGTCGDGRLDPGEACDDGNRLAGDGCSATCTVEVCGNSVADPGEECDDGNATSHDGCSSGCRIEQPTWARVTTPGPPLRRGHVMAWDPDHGHGLVHGGTGSTVLGDTWVWTGSWHEVPIAGPARTFHAIAWDRAGRLVIYGGADPNTVRSSDSFAWDGAAWSKLGGTAAEGRFDHAMGSDVARGQLVMFGGVLFSGLNSETWVRDDAGWRRVLTTAPSGMGNHGVRFTFDPFRKLLLKVGGSATAFDTLAWDGAAWTRPDDSPESGILREDHVQEYDTARRRLITFAGGAPFPKVTNEVDEFDGTSWKKVPVGELPVGELPVARVNSAGFYDPIRHELVIFGGASGTTFFDDTWTMRWTSDTPDDACDGVTDDDGDGLVGCADPDCWARCTPHCPPGATCDPGEPRCGDGVCNPALETKLLCPSDC